MVFCGIGITDMHKSCWIVITSRGLAESGRRIRGTILVFQDKTAWLPLFQEPLLVGLGYCFNGLPFTCF
jgi:hypothetical protein